MTTQIKVPDRNDLFLFDSIIDNYDFYKEAALEYKTLGELEEFFLEVREKTVAKQLNDVMKTYAELVENVQKTNVGKNSKDRFEIAHQYFIKDFFESPVYYVIHLLNYYNKEFIKENVIVEGLDILQEELAKNKTVILNGLHMDLYQVLLNYIADLIPNRTISLFGVEQSLRKIEKINSLYTPTIKNIEYSYIDSLDDKPYPLIFKKAFRDIEENKIVTIPPEVSMGMGPSEKTRLVGLDVLLPQGSSLLSNRYSIPVILVHTVRIDKSKIKITFEKPIYPFEEKNRAKVKEQSEVIFDKISEIVSMYPETWSGYDILHYLTEGVYRKEDF